jgi:adenylate kinase family enzyme
MTVIFVLGAPGAGKGTLCAHLANVHNLVHYSVGDNLRAYAKANPDTPLTETIKQKLADQGFLSPAELRPFLVDAINGADKNAAGILLDGFPRCKEQAEAFADVKSGYKPDLLVKFVVDKERAKARYLARGRDANDSAEKFEKRFEEYETESPPVEEIYAKENILVEVRSCKIAH